VIDSKDLHVYGAGFYSFFNNYDASKSTPLHFIILGPCGLFSIKIIMLSTIACSTYGGPQNCQNSIFSIEGQSAISVYNLNVLGSKSLVDQDGKSLASYSDNIGVFTNNIAYFSTK
jgi:glucan 1,3-beta-glucosidase